MIETKASKYMYAHCTYALQPHSHTCRTHINHVASQRDMNLSVLPSRRSWDSNVELQRRTVYDREPKVQFTVHITPSFSHIRNTHQPYRQWERLEYTCMTISIKTKLRMKYRIAGKFGGELNLAVWRSIITTAKLKSAKISYSHIYVWRSRTEPPNLNPPIFFQ